MEEKERYKIDKSTNYYTNTIVDTKTNAYYGNIEEHIDLLNQQDKENQQLKQQLHDLPKKIVEEIKQQLFNYFEVKNIEDYEKLPLIDCLFTADTVIEILDKILKKHGGENE